MKTKSAVPPKVPSKVPPKEAPDPGSSALRSLIRATRGAFGKPLRVERSEGGLSVILEGDGVGNDGTAPAGRAATSADSQTRLMRHDLKAHLDRCANSRAVLPYVRLLEQGLERRGMRVFDDIPLPALKRSAAQLEVLAQEPVMEGLALLQARLDVAIVGREESIPVQCKPNALSSFFVDHKMEVSEASMSDFLTIAASPATVPAKLGER